MEAHARGDGDAFPELFRRWVGRLFGYMCHMTGDRELAKDLVQETFIRVHRARNRFDSSRPFRPWVFQIASRVRADTARSWFWRLRRRTVSLFGAEGEEGRAWADRVAAPPEAEPHRTHEARDLGERVRRVVSGLNEPYREAIVLHDLEGMTCREIALVTGRPIGTVLSRIRRGREILHERLVASGGRGEWS